jgi:hypothetical protein
VSIITDMSRDWTSSIHRGTRGEYKYRILYLNGTVIGQVSGYPQIMYQLRQYIEAPGEFYISEQNGGPDLFGPFPDIPSALTAVRFSDLK